MATNRFSDVDYGKVSNWRRVGHSASNYLSTIDRKSFGFGASTNQIVNTASNFAGIAGGVAGAIALAGVEAAGAAAFLASVAGPQVAVTAAVVGLALIVKGAYSNREAAHKALSDYVWSLIDDEPPMHLDSKERLDAAAEAALTLMEDGKNQIKGMGKKMAAAQVKFGMVNAKMAALYAELVLLRADKTKAKQGGAPQMVPILDGKIIALKARAQELWTKEVKTDGGIFEYVRRCSHTANYLQAPGIIALSMMYPLDQSIERRGKARSDFFLGVSLAANLRKTFTDLDALYSDLASPERV